MKNHNDYHPRIACKKQNTCHVYKMRACAGGDSQSDTVEPCGDGPFGKDFGIPGKHIWTIQVTPCASATYSATTRTFRITNTEKMLPGRTVNAARTEHTPGDPRATPETTRFVGNYSPDRILTPLRQVTTPTTKGIHARLTGGIFVSLIPKHSETHSRASAAATSKFRQGLLHKS